MDYSKLSDREINALVSKILRPKFPTDYCNDPAAAWPIIEKHGITLAYDGNDWVALHFSRVDAAHINEHERHTNKPLRAGLVLWLMMREGEGE